jgi:hypothetical protein
MPLDADRDVQNENLQSWRKLWDQAVQERDPGHLMKLLTEINDLLDQRNRAALRHETDRHKQVPMTIRDNYCLSRKLDSQSLSVH